MRPLPRDPEKFDLIDLFANVTRQYDIKLHDGESERKFLDAIGTSLGRNKTATMLYGLRTESMFAHVAASLGKCRVIKKEDAGQVIMHMDSAKVPDYRIVTHDDQQVLVEVKNCHKGGLSSTYKMKKDYVDALIEYASAVSTPLMIAVYWSKWNQWTLVSPEDLEYRDTLCSVGMLNALTRNRMGLLGDIHIGTRVPLTLRLLANRKRTRLAFDDGRVQFTIGDVELLSAGRRIENKSEQAIALYLLLWGDWPVDTPVLCTKDGELHGVDYVSEPEEITPGQGFDIVGSLSGMISRQFKELTMESDRIARVTPRAEPGSLGVEIPLEYKGTDLPLWIIVQQAASEVGVGGRRLPR